MPVTLPTAKPYLQTVKKIWGRTWWDGPITRSLEGSNPGLKDVLYWWNACIAYLKPWVQSPAPHKLFVVKVQACTPSTPKNVYQRKKQNAFQTSGFSREPYTLLMSFLPVTHWSLVSTLLLFQSGRLPSAVHTRLIHLLDYIFIVIH